MSIIYGRCCPPIFYFTMKEAFLPYCEVISRGFFIGDGAFIGLGACFFCTLGGETDLILLIGYTVGEPPPSPLGFGIMNEPFYLY